MRKVVEQLRKKTIKELEKEIIKQRELIAKLRLQVKVNPPKDTNQLGKERKKLAQLLTIAGEKKEEEKIKRELEKKGVKN
jgi:ribosomal protein L29